MNKRVDNTVPEKLAEVWLLRVNHPADFPVTPGWVDVGIFETASSAQAAVTKLAAAGRAVNDAKGNCFELKRFDVRK